MRNLWNLLVFLGSSFTPKLTICKKNCVLEVNIKSAFQKFTDLKKFQTIQQTLLPCMFLPQHRCQYIFSAFIHPKSRNINNYTDQFWQHATFLNKQKLRVLLLKRQANRTTSKEAENSKFTTQTSVANFICFDLKQSTVSVENTEISSF